MSSIKSNLISASSAYEITVKAQHEEEQRCQELANEFFATFDNSQITNLAKKRLTSCRISLIKDRYHAYQDARDLIMKEFRDKGYTVNVSSDSATAIIVSWKFDPSDEDDNFS